PSAAHAEKAANQDESQRNKPQQNESGRREHSHTGKRRVPAGKRFFSAIPRIVVLPPASVGIEEGKEIGLSIKPHPAVKHRPKRMQFTGASIGMTTSSHGLKE